MSDREYLAEVFRALGRRAPSGEVVGRRIGALCDLRRGDRVLDVGAGKGATARLLAREFGCEVTGVEPEEAAVAAIDAAAREAGLEVLLRGLRADPAALDLPEESFDVVVAEGSLGLVGDAPEPSARQLRRFLKANGRLATTLTARVARSLPAAIARFFAEDLKEPLLWPRELAGALERAGFEPLTAECLPEALVDAHYKDLEAALPGPEGSPRASLLARSLEVYRGEGGRTASAPLLFIARRKEPGERPPQARGVP